MSSVNYVAYVVVGGSDVILGPLVGATLLVWASNLFSLQGQISQGLFGLLLMFAVLVAKGGVVGSARKLAGRIVPTKAHAGRTAEKGKFA